jgi:hypothetical protein
MKPTNGTDPSVRMARRIWTNLSREALSRLREITEQHHFSIPAGDLTYLENGWYVTHTGLLGLARRNRCAGIHVRPVSSFCDPSSQRWAFETTVYKSRTCRGFVGWYMARKCAWPRLGRSTEHCAKPMASASARSKRSARSRDTLARLLKAGRPRNRRMATEISGVARSEIAFARSSASISWMPLW